MIVSYNFRSSMISYLLNYYSIQTSAAYASAIDALCDGGTTGPGDACDSNAEAIDEVCFTLLGLANTTTCTGSCGTQLATAAAFCTATVSYDRGRQIAVRTYMLQQNLQFGLF